MNDSLPSLEASPFWHPYTPVPFPQSPRTRFTRAQGAYVWNETGDRYFDATSSWWCITHGHCHPLLGEAVRRQAGEMDQVMPAPHSHPLAEQLAAGLVGKLGSPFQKVFFSDDGSTAVECALKMARQYWRARGQGQRDRFVAIDGAYHGDTLGALSVGQLPVFHSGLESLAQTTLRAPTPDCLRCPVARTFPSCEIACLDRLRESLRTEGDRIAALIVEPLILGAAGMLVYPAAYLERLVQIAREVGALVIFDEVFTGFGRTGTLFAFEQLSAKPDIVCLSKGLTGGMLALGATVTTREVFDAFCGSADKMFAHGHTFTANPIACAVALANLEIFDSTAVLATNRSLSLQMATQVERFAALPHVGTVRTLGMVWALELVVDKKSGRLPSPTNRPGWSIARALWEKKIWLRPLHQVVYVAPPYCTTASELERFFDLLFEEIQKAGHWGE